MPPDSDSAARYVMFGPGVISMISAVSAKASRGLMLSMPATLTSLRGSRTCVGSMRLVPIIRCARIDVQRHREQHGGEGRVLHDVLHDRQRRRDFLVRHFEDQLVMHLQQHLRGELLLGEYILDTGHGAADDVRRSTLQARVDSGAFVE